MAVAVDAVHACGRALVLEAPQLVDVAALCRDEAAPAGERLGLIEHLALLRVADRDLARSSALGPSVLERKPVAAIGPFRPDLDRLAPPQTEGCLQPQGHRRVGVGDPGELAAAQLARLADAGDVLPVADAVVVVVAGDDVLLADLLGPPSQFRHPVLDRAHGQAFRLPALDQPLDVLGLEARRGHVPVAHVVQLTGHQVEHALAIALRREAAVAVAPAQLLQLVVQVAHSAAVGIVPRPVGCPSVVISRCRWCSFGQVSVSVRPGRRSAAGTTRDTGHHSRFVPSHCWPPRHTALAPMALPAGRRSTG